MLDTGYLAGLIDGEGCLSFRYDGRKTILRLYPALVIHMTNYEIIKLLHNEFGGSFGTIQSDGIKKISYTWQFQGEQVISIVQRVYPYLIVKKQQADLILGYHALGENGEPKVNAFFKKEMALLNKRGL